MRRFLGAAAIGFCVAGAIPAANASIILDLVGGAPVAVAGGFDYTYGATLSQDEQIDPAVQPVFFTLYSFGTGTLINTTGDLSNWSFQLNTNETTYAEGVVPNNTTADDIRATYPSNGAVILPTSIGTGIDNLGTFTVFTTNTGPYAVYNNDQDAQLEKYAPGTGTNDTITSNLAAVSVPTNGRPSVPEPASLTLLGSALLGLGVARRRFQRKG